MEYKIKLRIVALKPPIGFWFWLENNKGNIFRITESEGKDIVFDFDAIVKENKNNDNPNFAGEFASGTPSERFFYVNYGKFAGQMEGRAKIWISGTNIKYPLGWEITKDVVSDSNKVLMARYLATDKNGRPKSASVELMDDGWILHRSNI